jgi:hypothetical protein
MKISKEDTPDEFKKVQEAILLLRELILLNKGIEGHQWMSALVFIIAKSNSDTGMTYDKFVEDMNEAFEFYKERFDGIKKTKE